MHFLNGFRFLLSIFFAVSLCLPLALWGQDEGLYDGIHLKQSESLNINHEDEWRDGVVTDNDGKILKGQLRFVTNTNTLYFRVDSTTRSFSPWMVREFWFFEPQMQQRRTFYSLSADELQGGAGTPHFFELLRQFKSFAVLSGWADLRTERNKRKDPAVISFGGSLVVVPLSSAMDTPEKTVLTEIIYIFDDSGKITPYLRLKDEHEGTVFFSHEEAQRSKHKRLDYDAIKKYTQPYYDQLKNYATENSLKFNRKLDLLNILDYYSELAKDGEQETN